MQLRILVAVIFLTSSYVEVMAEEQDMLELESATAANPLIQLHPSGIQNAAEAYYAEVEKHIFNGAIPLKHAQLAALSASVAMRCEYCIPAHTALAKAAGATDEELKTAVAIAADVALNSSMLYGSQFNMSKFMQMFPQ